MTEITFTGVVDLTTLSPGWVNYYGLDNGGYFGPAGASLVGDTFTATFTGDYATNTVYDATLTINGHTFDFGGGHSLDDFISNDHLYQYQDDDGGNVGLVFSSNNSIYGGNAEFFIFLGDDGTKTTQAYMTNFGAPAPIVGTGPLAFALFLFFAYRHLRRWGCLYSPSHRGEAS